MSGKRHIRTLARRGNHVACAIDRSTPSQPTKLIQEPRRALLFQERGRRDAAELQVHFADPLLFAREPLQTLAHSAVFRQFTQVYPDCRIGSHAAASVAVRSEPGCYWFCAQNSGTISKHTSYGLLDNSQGLRP